MSTGSIIDFQVKIKPSGKLVDFILSLDGENKMPENVIKIISKHERPKKGKIEIFDELIKSESLTSEEKAIIKEFKLESSDFESAFEHLEIQQSSDEEEIEDLGSNDETADQKSKKKKKTLQSSDLLNLNDLKWINKILTARRATTESAEYLHELLQGSKLILPKNEIIPRNPELEARCKRLRVEQENRTYKNMTKDVDAVRRTLPEDTLAYQMKSINSQIIAVLQFVFSVVAGFAFGFLGVELIIGNLDFGFRLLLGIICALTIALAEIYFLAKKLNELDDMNEPVLPPATSNKKVHTD